MNEIFSAFGSEVFRPLVTLVLPGAIGLSAWFIALWQRWQALRDAVQAKPTETFVILASLAVAAGLVFEDLGSQIEACIDRRLDKKKGNHTETWYKYLCHAFKVKPIGELYLRTLVLRLKFELDTSVALISAAIGTLFVATPNSVGIWLPILLVLLAAYLVYEAWNTCVGLSKLREELIKGITVVG